MGDVIIEKNRNYQKQSNILTITALILSVVSFVFCIFIYGNMTTQDTISKRSYLKNRGRVEKLEREVIYLNSRIR